MGRAQGKSSPVAVAGRRSAQAHAESTAATETKAGTVTVSIGKQVIVTDVETSKEQSYFIVAPGQSNPVERKLSSESPVARALSGHSAGDTVVVHLPRGQRELLIVSVA